MELSSMSQDELLALGLLAGGLVLAALKFGWLMFRMNLNAEAFTSAVHKLIDAGDLDRAVKLCRAVPGALVTSGTLDMLQAHQNGDRDSASLREAFERGTGGTTEKLKKLGWAPPLAIAAAAAGLYLLHRAGIPFQPYHLGLGGAALFLVVLTYRQQASIKKTTLAARDAIIEKLSA